MENVEQISEHEQFNVENAGQYLTFKLDTEMYGIEILKVREIIGLIQITRVPRMPEYVKGVINLRGKVIPIIDLRMAFSLPEVQPTKRTCIVVVEVEIDDDSVQVGVIVDEVDEVLDFVPNSIEPAPEYGGGHIKTEFIKAMGKINNQVKILLDIDKVISNTDISLLQEG